MIAVPVLTPVTIPVLPTVATPVFALLQLAPGVAEPSVVVPPTHMLPVPVIAAGTKPTVTVATLRQPVDNVYVMFDVPAAAAVTVPSVPTVATAVVPLLHVPPEGEVLNDVVVPLHRNNVPLIASGTAFTVTSCVI